MLVVGKSSLYMDIKAGNSIGVVRTNLSRTAMEDKTKPTTFGELFDKNVDNFFKQKKHLNLTSVLSNPPNDSKNSWNSTNFGNNGSGLWSNQDSSNQMSSSSCANSNKEQKKS